MGGRGSSSMSKSISSKPYEGPDEPIRGADAIYNRLQHLRVGDIIEYDNMDAAYKVITQLPGKDEWVHAAPVSIWSDEPDGPSDLWMHETMLPKRKYHVDNPTYKVVGIVGRSYLRRIERDIERDMYGR